MMNDHVVLMKVKNNESSNKENALSERVKVR